MRHRRMATVIGLFLAVTALLATIVFKIPQAAAQSDPARPIAPAGPSGTSPQQAYPSPRNKAITAGIRSTDRISIPYGFQDNLPLLSEGQIVIARGHGGCTAGQQFTVDVSVTQDTYGVVGAGQTTGTCDGQLQTWYAIVQVYPGSTFIAGPAEACGAAATSEDGRETDTFEWCKDVVLDALDNQLYLPLTAAEQE